MVKSNPNGRYVKTSINLIPYMAFVPNPLPPELESSWQMVNIISEADRAISELVGISCNLRNPNLLIAPFKQREAVLSSRIEGTQTTMSDLLAYQLREAPLPGFDHSYAPVSDNKEVLNYVKAIDWGISAIQDHPIDEALILELHRIMLTGARGEHATPGHFRNEQNYIGASRNPDHATYFPPPIIEMKRCLLDLFRYIGRGDIYPPLIRIAILHYQFEAIHPFRDGNGRIGRLLIILLMIKWGLLPAPLLYVSAAFERNRDKYYELLLGVSEKGNWSDWLFFFLESVRDQALDGANRGSSLIKLRDEWRAMLIEKRASPASQKLSELLFEIPIFTIPEAQKRLGYKDYNSPKRAVAQLLELGIIENSSDTNYEKSYQASEILNIIS
jgi:Fic family protein